MSVNESGTNKTSKDIVIQGLEQQLDQCRTQNAKLEAEKQLMDKKLKKKGGRKRKTKKRRQKGGAEDLSFKKPMVSNVSAAGAIQGTMHKQAKGNEEMVELKKSMAGGGEGVIVPQMSQAGAAGNESIGGSIATTLQGRADAKYDKDVYNKPKSSGMPGGGRKRRKKRKTKRKSKKSKKRRRKRKTKKRRKSKKRRR